jgi:beta-glucosidase
MTQNEPQCYLGLGHSVGRQAPGLQLPFRQVLEATHHSLLAHGLAVQQLRAHSADCMIGAAPVSRIGIPATESEADIAAARAYTFSFDPGSLWTHSWYSDPMILGRYPEEGLEAYREDLPAFSDEDMRTICQPLDFFGVNCYNGNTVRADATAPQGWTKVEEPQGAPRSAFDWPVTPAALRYGPRFLHERYQLPIVITENGLANTDWVALDGKVHDPQRIDFLHRYLLQFHKAMEDGVPCLGYFQWSIMDNFEWAEGYRRRFGLVYVDYATQQRIPKDSAYWYRDTIQANGANLFAPAT